MRRIGIIAVLSLSLVALAAPGVSAFGDHHGDRGHRHGHHGLHAWAGQGEQGGTLEIRARVGGHRGHHEHGFRVAAPQFGCDLAVSAVVHFAVAGDVATDLTPLWDGSRLFGGSVAVASDEAVGPVAVDVTATCGNRSAMVTVMGEVVAASDPEPEPPPQDN